MDGTYVGNSELNISLSSSRYEKQKQQKKEIMK